MTVLVIDDEPTIRRALRVALEAMAAGEPKVREWLEELRNAVTQA